ncbi:MAG TPA: MMPL family transporter [Baekduia sp.]|nr:MMPL family transporter [Baekduia sp.]
MGWLERLARLMARRRKAALWASLAIVAGALVLVPTFRSNLEGIGYETPGSESAAALEAVRDAGGPAERASLVAVSAQPNPDRLRATMRRAAGAIAGHATVTGVSAPVLARDGRAAYAIVGLDGATGDRQDAAEALQHRVDEVAGPGVELDLTGTSPLFADLLRVEEEDLVVSEAVGVPLAFAVLLFALGGLVAAGLPILVAVAGLLTTFGFLGFLSLFTSFNIFVENIVAMVGLGVGIDYAMLIVRRYREERERGDGDTEAIARTMATAGRTVVFSGAAVAVCLAPLAFTGMPFFAETAVGAVAVLVIVVLAAITLLPALLVALGDRIDKGGRRRRATATGGRWEAWSRRVMRRPWLVLGLAVVLLLGAAIPVVSLEEGNDLNAAALRGEPSGRALAALEEHFPELALSPVEVAAADGAAARAARAALEADERFAGVRATPLGDGAALVSAAPTVAVDSPAAERAVHELRAELSEFDERILVGGYTAESIDFTDEMDAGTPLVVGMALVLCFLVLLMVFRSPLLALKAIIANLLSLAAAFGLLVLVFQEGLGEQVLDFTSPGYIQSWMPLTLFMIVFGLSMDYEVFMVTRMREEYDRLGSTTDAVALGLQRTGGVVTSAAAIMVVIFSSFMLARAPEIKQFGFALAAAVLIDATIVRAALVPAFMRVAGRWNWWMPVWLDRVLPRLAH